MRLVLFDIDGTLMLSSGVGMRAFYRAIREIFDLAADSEVVRPDGMTDPLIAQQVLNHFGQLHRWNEQSQEALYTCYLEHLDAEMQRAAESGRLHILPGVVALLDRLAMDPEVCVGLATGNLEGGARIKLDHAGLLGYFRFGGYGSDSEDRTELTRIGIARGRSLVTPRAVEDSVVIGDTPLDIIHGQGAGARVIAVASSRYTRDELAAYQPHLVVDDLSPADLLISFIHR